MNLKERGCKSMIGKKFFVLLMVIGLALGVAAAGFCAGPEDNGPEDDYDYSWHRRHGMQHRHGGWGGHARGGGRRMGPSRHGWESMKPEQREQWQKRHSEFQVETLELRKQLASKQVELETLWAQPNVDKERVEKLSEEVAQLEGELAKKRSKYLLRCRHEFGDKGWACPSGW
jgi:Spy/CpxP family protein refolding chaperone